MTEHTNTGSSRFANTLSKDIYTPDEAAYLLGIDVDTIYTAAQRGDLKATFIGNDLVSVERGDLVAWLDSSEG